MPIKKREVETPHSDLKLQALARWKSGDKIAGIARDLQISRETMYRWVKEADEKLKRRSRRVQVVDHATQLKIIEAYVVLKAPSMAELKRIVESLYHLQVSTHQLRRWLIKWGWGSFQPSKLLAQHIKTNSV